MRQAARAMLTLAFSLLMASIAGHPLHAQERLVEEHWHAIFVADQKAGYQHSRVTEEVGAGDMRYRTLVRQEFALARGGVRLNMKLNADILENASGSVLAFEQTLDQGIVKQTVRGRRVGDEMLLTTVTGGGERTRRIPAPEGLGPYGEHQLKMRMGFEPGTQYTAQVFVPDAPNRSVTAEVTVGGREEVEVFGATKRLHRLETVYSILPGVVNAEWLDEGGAAWLVRTAPIPGFALELLKASEPIAKAQSRPAELLALSYVQPQRLLNDARKLRYLKVLLKGKAGELPASPPSGPWQKQWPTNEGVVVEVHGAMLPEKTYRLPYAGEEYRELLAPNRWLEADDELIRRMAAEATGGQTLAAPAARSIESYVSDHIVSKGLGVGMATAGEAARAMAGDCSEHAVLVAALARAAGIPSRVVGGLVYATVLPGAQGGGFGYHMWAEAYVGEWLPLDAALGGHDATHIAIVRSDLNSPGSMLEMSAEIIRFLGKIDIEVLESRL